MIKTKIRIPHAIAIKKKNSYLIINGSLGNQIVFLFYSKNWFISSKYLYFKSTSTTYLNKALLNFCVSQIYQAFIGVQVGFKQQLNLRGLGYKCFLNDSNQLLLKVGFSHLIYIGLKKEIKINCSNNNTVINLFGTNKQKVNEFAFFIKKFKKPEPYKGKGIFYKREQIVQKQIKKS